MFPGENLVESAGKLIYKACRENVAVEWSVVVNHIKSRKHAESKERLQMKTARERDIAAALQKHDAETHRKGETLPDPHKVYRVKVVTAFIAPFTRSKPVYSKPVSNTDCCVHTTIYLSDLIRFIV